MIKTPTKQKDFLRGCIALLVVVFLTANFFVWPKIATAEDDKVEETKESIEKIEEKLAREQKEQEKLQKALNSIQTDLSQTVQSIKSTQTHIESTQEQIERKKAEIDRLEDKLKTQKTILAELMQQLYFKQAFTEASILFASTKDSPSIFGEGDSMASIQDSMLMIIDIIEQSKASIESEKSALEGLREEKENLLAQQESQKNALFSNKVSTEGNIAKKEATIGELSGKLAALKSDLSKLLGSNISTDDIVEAAEIASAATGVRKDFILGALVVETDLGRFTGGCYYKDIRMRDADKKEFLRIAEELSKAYGGDYKKKKLSCSPSWGGYGGAMGVAQFMPTTWIGYEDYIASATGHNPPDPWSIIDGVMAMAKKLANDGATKKSGERLSAKRYYCGGPGSSFWNTKCEDYADRVLYWADNYEKKL